MATVAMPIARQVRATRRAISPRLAMRILRMVTGREATRKRAPSPSSGEEDSLMRDNAVSFLAGFGAGALFAALLDPRRGAARRALIRDKAVSLARKAGVEAVREGRDLSNRTRGLAHEISARRQEEHVSDDIL